MLYITQTALNLGFVYALVSLALFLSFRILDIADLTTDGSFVLGMAISLRLAGTGHPLLAIPVAMLAAAAAGIVTALLQTKLGVPSILAGIITNTGLYSVNLMAMEWSSNISILGEDTVFDLFQHTGIGGSWYKLIVFAAFTIAAMLAIYWFLGTRVGLSIRATGDNIDMVRASSINPALTITVGLGVANALTGLSGALVGQMQKSASIDSGTGIVIVGLACLIIGETLVGRKSIPGNILAVLVGSIVYRFIYAIVLKTKIVPIEGLKLLTAIIVALAIAMPAIKEQMRFRMQKAKALKNGTGSIKG